MNTQEQYHGAELMTFMREAEDRNSLPLHTRQKGRWEILNRIETDYTWFKEHLSMCTDFLLNGDYGHGALLTYQKIPKRMNRAAWLFSTVLSLEFQTSYSFAQKTWHHLNEAQQAEINAELGTLISMHEAE